MDNAVEEVKKRIDIVDFIGGFISLKKSGRNFKALCPFHQEKTPSLVISPDRQIWHCFGACQTGGDVIAFLMKWENLTFYEVLKQLAKKVGVRLAKVDFEDQAWQTKTRLLTLNNAAFEFYHYLLTKHSIGKKALDYLSGRGVDQKLLETFGLGYAPSSWDSLLKFLKKRGFALENGVEAGLLVKNERGHFYDRFRGRIIFPLHSPSGQILGFSGRTLGESRGAKYINVAESPIYHKRETLFGLDVAREAIRKSATAILVEGEFDMISAFKSGAANTVAVKGAAVTYDQLMLLRRFAKKLIFCLDADFSGQETTKKAIGDAEGLEFEIAAAPFPGKDPDEAIKNDPAGFKASLAKPLPIYDFLIQIARKRHPEADAAARKSIGDEVVPYLIGIKNPIVQSYYVKKLAGILEVEPRAVEILMGRARRAKSKPKMAPHPERVRGGDRFELMQKYILHLVLQEENPKDLAAKIEMILESKDFTVPAHEKLWKRLKDYLGAESVFNLQQFARALPGELLPVLDQIALFDISIFDPALAEKSLHRTLYTLKNLSLKKQVRELLAQEGTEEEVTALMKTLSKVEKKLTVV